MKDGNWIPVDKRLINLLPKNREYTYLEAYISLRIDIESEAKISINGYARLWSWSRNKVRYFIDGLRTGKGHAVDTQRTGKGQEIRLIFNNIQEQKNSQGTVKGQAKDSQGTTTIISNKKKENLSSSSDEVEEFFLTKKQRKLSGKRLMTFNQFWDAFKYKSGKAEAADSWLDIPILTEAVVLQIIAAAKNEADNRSKLIDSGKTPKMAQGWLSGRRWEDEKETPAWMESY